MHLRPPSLPSTPRSSAYSSRSPSTALTTPSPAPATQTQPRLLTPSGLRDVRIPVESIGPALAAGLVMTALESVLYVKSQVPMSVQQMTFLGESGKNARAVKKRVELLQTLDTLSSHLTTTFIQLSCAFARCSTPLAEGETERTHIMITLGPPSGITKERVLLELEGLEVKDWAKPVELEFLSDDSSDEDDDEATDEDAEEESEREEEEAVHEQEDDPAQSHEDVDTLHSPDVPSPTLQPEPSLSQSVSSASSSRQSSLSPLSSPCPLRTQPPAAAAQRPAPDPTRMLALALINLSQSQLPPTHVHLLLRAPRRFAHVSWAPRQTLTRALEASCFGVSGSGAGVSRLKKSEPERITVISSHPPSHPAPRPMSVSAQPLSPAAAAGSPAPASPDEEEDEMIWFEWTGKLMGFMEI